ncbi:3-phosphoshikimate 1-carboxyvinyltransferase [Ornithinimicrobium pratense]|uniref:3-phosphoshikimate 1-carboxyvinyltransferase n=1 Tax=Ornithinimicrobium pratense TaxID=2593973 RepID=A0A5J6V5W8_9MICO|nr:3-phosphoshikimate 1-carboxyvinyltransferase [Ornithinimicrobium pratense]QFG69158.1 3-phosphoshikimate 1-carboxyvinyltransferase [Ornithinimicrobium pratense]
MTAPTPDVAPPTWAAPCAAGPVDGQVRVPGSKSLTNRWLVLAALADGPCTLHHPLRSSDTEHMVGALRILGVRIDTSEDDRWVVEPPLERSFTSGVEVDCGQAGTVMRFVPPLAALADGPVRFVGHHSALARPVGPVLDGLRALGVAVDDEGRGTLPFTVRGIGRGRPAGSAQPLEPGRPTVPDAGADSGLVPPALPRVRIDASASSQFVSALLLAGSAYPAGLHLEHTGSVLPSLPHVQMTLEVLDRVGVVVDRPTPTSWRVHPGPVRAFEIEVEPDLSSAAPFLALAAVTGGRMCVPGWPSATSQPGERMREVLEAMGARTELAVGTLTVHGAPGGRLRGVDLDLGEVGELTPVVSALAVVAHGPSRLRGVGHLRGHETDRLTALATEITRLGAGARETPDGLEIEPAPLRPARLRTYHDHRMAMFAAVVGAVAPGVLVEDVATVGKTYPGFDRVWSTVVASAEGGVPSIASAAGDGVSINSPSDGRSKGPAHTELQREEER